MFGLLFIGVVWCKTEVPLWGLVLGAADDGGNKFLGTSRYASGTEGWLGLRYGECDGG